MKPSDDLNLELITPEGVLYSGPVGLVEVPGSAGRFMILRDHAAIISTLKKGSIRVIGKDSVERRFDCSAGVVECVDNKVTILM
jgi:F-type H+-transporting ATPase subunit epsilon